MTRIGLLSDTHSYLDPAVFTHFADCDELWHAGDLRFELEGFSVWITHIGGAPPRYNPTVRPILQINSPSIFVCGHSHILKVVRDPKLANMLYLNPGAAGKTGFHLQRTCLRFTLDTKRISDMQVIELGKR
jgi:predicted phosphodiesterase